MIGRDGEISGVLCGNMLISASPSAPLTQYQDTLIIGEVTKEILHDTTTSAIDRGIWMHLAAEKLAARRGDDLIFVDISFYLTGGEALVLTGRNGSGKSTLLRVVAGFLRSEKGSVTFTDSGGRTDQRLSEVSHYLGHRNAMKNELTVAENLDFWRSFLDDGSQAPTASIEDAAEAVGLGGITHLPFGYLSAGQQRRFAFAKLLVANRPIWILDEPTAALDTNAGRLFSALIGEHQRKGGIVLAATHQSLGLSNVQELRMKGFAGAETEIWGA